MSGPIEVEGPDGSIVEFPEGTPPDVMEKAMAAHFSTGAMPDAGASPDAQGIPNPAAPVWNPQTGKQDSTANYKPSSGLYDAQGKPLPANWQGEAYDDQGRFVLTGTVTDDTPNPAANVANGPLEELGAVGGAIFRGVAALPDMFLDARDAIFPNIQTDRSRFSDIPEMLGAKEVNSPGVEFAANVLGGMVVPGPKTAPQPIKAPAQGAVQDGKVLAADTAADVASDALTDKGFIPNARQVVEAGKEFKVPTFRTDLKPPKTRLGESARMIGENIWLAGTGGKRAGQQQARIEAVEGIAKEYGAPDLGVIGETSQAATNRVTEAFTAARGKELSRLTGIKDMILDNIPGAVQTPNASRAIDEQIQRLRGINEEAFAPVIEKLKSFERVLESGKSLREVEGNRKLLGDLFADPSLASIKGEGQKALNAIYSPLRQDMATFIEASAGKGAAARFKEANDKLAAMAGELSDAKFKRVLKTADATPENISKMLFSQTASDVKRLVANLDDAGKAKAEAAIVLKAVENAMTDGVVSPQKFASGMEAMRTATGLIATPQSAARLEGLTRLLKATQQASKAAAYPLSGAQLTPMAATGGLSAVLSPFLGGATIPAVGFAGIAARLYENKIPAQLMTQLGKTKPGSKTEAAIAQRLAPYIEKAIKAAPYVNKGLPVAADRIEKAAAMSPAPRVAAEDQKE